LGLDKDAKTNSGYDKQGGYDKRAYPEEVKNAVFGTGCYQKDNDG